MTEFLDDYKRYNEEINYTIAWNGNKHLIIHQNKIIHTASTKALAIRWINKLTNGKFQLS